MILDGAMGTAIQRDRPSEEGYRGERFADWPTDLQGNNDLLSLTQPEIIATIHREYLTAGADIIETNTFNATAISLGDYGTADHAYEINLESAQLARRVCDEVSTQTPTARGTSPAPSGSNTFMPADAVQYCSVARLTGHIFVNVTYPQFLLHFMPISIVLTLFAFFWRATATFRPHDAKLLGWEGLAFIFLRWPWSLAGSLAARSRSYLRLLRRFPHHAEGKAAAAAVFAAPRRRALYRARRPFRCRHDVCRR